MKKFADTMKITLIVIILSSFILGLYYENRTGSIFIFSTIWSLSGCTNDSKSCDGGKSSNSILECEIENRSKESQKTLILNDFKWETHNIRVSICSLLHLAMVVCGDRLREASVSLKSVALFTKSKVHAHLYADESASSNLTEYLNEWPIDIRERFNYTLYKIQYPPGLDSERWTTMLRPCATQRLFLPILMKDVDSVVYLDVDTILITSLQNVWNLFCSFNSTQIAGLGSDAEEPQTAWYRRSAATPYVPPYGVNSGVILMNLTRMRDVYWTNLTLDYYERYASKLKLGDQDLINIFFHFNPEKLFVFPCSWNFRADFCQYASSTSKCQSALTGGTYIVHGCSRAFRRHSAFKAVFNAFSQHMLNQSVENELLPRLKENLQKSSGHCRSVSHVFTRQIEKKIDCDKQRYQRENPRTIVKPLGV